MSQKLVHERATFRPKSRPTADTGERSIKHPFSDAQRADKMATVSNISMRRILFLLLWLPMAQAAATQTIGRPIVITLPADVEPASCEVQSFLRPFAGTGKPERPLLRPRSIEINTVQDGITAHSAKLWLSCRGFEVILVDLPAFDHATPIDIAPKLTRLPTVPFQGNVTGTDQPAEQLEVEVNYYPWWRCAFFGIVDCGMGGHQVTTAPLRADGRFSVELPDYLHQPEIRSYESHYRGEFQFVIRSRNNDRLLYRLKHPGSSSGRIREQAAYPGQQPFQAEPVK